MTRQALTCGAIIFVADGRKALFLRNDGDEKYPNLIAENVIIDDNPPTHEQGTDRPGRGFASAHAARHSAMETTDWHEIEERHFAQRSAEILERLMRDRSALRLAIVAPPKTLAELRRALPDDVKARIVLELDKDLTKHPISEIEKHVFAS